MMKMMVETVDAPNTIRPHRNDSVQRILFIALFVLLPQNGQLNGGKATNNIFAISLQFSQSLVKWPFKGRFHQMSIWKRVTIEESFLSFLAQLRYNDNLIKDINNI